jgi:hypothetical protein
MEKRAKDQVFPFIYPIQTRVRFGTTGSNWKVDSCISTITSVYYWRISPLKVVGFSKKLIAICQAKLDYIPWDHSLNIECTENLLSHTQFRYLGMGVCLLCARK